MRKLLLCCAILFPVLGWAQTITCTGTLNLCPGTTKILAATGYSGSPTFQWLRNGVAVPQATAFNYSATLTGSYEVVVTEGSNSSTYGPLVISATTNPLVDFTFSADGNCADAPITFTNSSTGNSLTYLWDFDDPLAGAAANASTATSPVRGFIGTAGNGIQQFNVKLTATDIDGCVATVAKNISKKQLPSTVLTEVQASKIYNNSIYFTNCTGVASQFTFFITPLNTTRSTNTNYKIEWGNGSADFNSGTFPAGGINQTYQPGTTPLTITVTGGNGCFTTVTDYVFVGSTPGIQFGTPGNTAICTGASLTFPITNPGNNTSGTIYTVSYSDGTPDIIYSEATLPASVTHMFNTTSCGAPAIGQYTNTFSATIKAENACNSSSVPVYPIYVSQAPTAAFSASALTVCVNETVNFNSAASINSLNPSGTCTSGAVVWKISPSTGFSVTGGNAALGDDNNGSLFVNTWAPGSTTINVKFTAAGTYNVTLRTGNSKCGTSEITKTICVNLSPTASFTLDQSSICAGLSVQATNTSAAPNCGVNTYSWSTSYNATSNCSPSVSSVSFSSTATNPSFSFTNPGTYLIKVTATSPGGCFSSTTSPVIVKSKPSLNLNVASSICVGSISPTASIGSCSGTISSYSWSLAGATPSNSSASSPGVVSYGTPGAYPITLAVTNECGTATISQTVTVKDVPTVSVPGNIQQCAGTSTGALNFTGTLPSTTFSWANNNTAINLGASGSGSIPSFTLANATISAIAATISVTPTLGGCSGAPGSFTITVNPKPPAPSVITPINYCQNSTSAQLTATGTNLMWYSNAALSGGVSTAPTPSTSSGGNQGHYVTQTVGSCTSVSSLINVNVITAVTNNTISGNQTVCAGSSAASLTGSNPTGGNGVFTYQWQSSTDGGSVWSNVGSASSYNPGTVSANTLYRRNVSSGACSQVSSNVITITIESALTNIAISSNQNICETSPPVAPLLLTGQLPVGGNGSFTYTWERSSDNVSWSPVASSNTQDYQPPVITSTTYYRRKVVSNSCNTTSSPVKLTVNNLPTTGTLSNTTVNTCFGSNVSLSTSGYTGSVKKWQYNFTPADNTAWVDVAASANSTVSFNNVQQSFVARVIVVQDGGCTSEATSGNIQVNVSAPTAPGTTAADATVCTAANSNTIVLTGSTGSVLRWERSTDNGNTWNAIANTTTSLGYLNLTSTTWYRAVVQNGFCPQAASGITRITVVPNVTASNAGADQALCAQNIVTLNGNNPSFGTGLWVQSGGPAVNISNPVSRNTQVTGLQSAQTYKFRWVISGPGACPSSSDEVQIVNTPTITQAAAGGDQVICLFTGPKDSVILTGNSLVNPAYETGMWSIVSATPTGSVPLIRDMNDPASRFVFDKVGAYQLAWTITNGACAATSDALLINVFDKPVVGPLTASTLTGCVGNDISISAGAALKGDVYKWQYNFSPNNATSWIDTAVTNPSIIFTNVQQSFEARLITRSKGISSGCNIADTAKLPIEIIPDFTNVIDTTELAVCPGQGISIAGQLPVGAYNVFKYQWQASKDGKTNWTNIAGQTSTSLNLVPLATTYIRRMVIVSPCEKASSVTYVYVRPSVGNFLMSDSVGTCFPFDVTFTNLVLPSSSTTWNFGDGAFNEGDVVTHTYHSTGTFQVVMTAQYPGGCRFEATKTVTITGPKGIFKYDHNQVCANVPLYFEVSSPGIDSVRWNFGDGQSIITTSKVSFHAYKQAGPYVPYVELLAGPGGACRTRITGLDTLFIDQVKAGFRQSIVQNCAVTDVGFTDTARAFYGIRSWRWDFGDGGVSSDKNPVHSYMATNEWRVRQIITGNSGCSDTATKTIPIRVWDIPKIKTNRDSIACVGQTVPYEASVFSGDGIKSTDWNFSNGSGATTLTAPKIYSFPGSYIAIFVATSVNNCADTVRLPITVYPKPSIDLGNDKILSTGTTLKLTSTVINGPATIWDWLPVKDLDCANCALPEATIKNDVTYVVKIATAQGCTASDSMHIKVFCEGAQVFVPNVFTPDGDGMNDVLMVRAKGIRTVKSFRIFNRWGEVVFEKSNFVPNDKSNGWDGTIRGKKATPDVYIYTYEVVCENNVTYTNKGNITLIK